MQPQLDEELLGYVTFGCKQKKICQPLRLDTLGGAEFWVCESQNNSDANSRVQLFGDCDNQKERYLFIWSERGYFYLKIKGLGEQKRFARLCAWTRSMVRNSGFVNHRIRVMPFLGISCLVTLAIRRRDIFLFGN